MCKLKSSEQIKKGRLAKKKLTQRRNLLLKYSKIVEIYNTYKERDVPATRILKNFIAPLYPISYRTLMNVLGTPISKELKEIDGEIRAMGLL